MLTNFTASPELTELLGETGLALVRKRMSDAFGDEVLAEALDHGRELQQALDQARRAAHRTGQQFDRLAFQPEPDVDAAGA
ncbi:hypothetical protein [Amycolatopsis sp. cmx-4-61]|uniref:hypothetical protein n=1 Tax=Amycolatopsis sp. cmx-4-61 TaxID=2790937 RepID=UPI00397D7D05